MLIAGIVIYLKFVKEPNWNEFPEDITVPDMTPDKKRKRRLKVAIKGNKDDLHVSASCKNEEQ